MKIQPEEALQKTTRKFIAGFRYIEQQVEKQGRALRDLTFGEMDALWEEAKERSL